MKKFPLFFFCLILSSLLSAQGSVKKYLLIEHFTNSNCGTCAFRNPAFFNLIGQAQYADDVHHVSVHPMLPYPQCVFYQANTTENTAWTTLNGISGTPTIVLNGALQNPSNPILTEAKLLMFLGQTSPLHLKVEESGPNNDRQVTVTAKAIGEIPAGNYKIFAAVVEKTVNQLTPNGESVHHNVFRKMLTAVSGNDFTVPTVGATSAYSYNFSIPANWNANEIYVLSFVKEVDAKQVLNSGTRFDPALSGTDNASLNKVMISPNPASDFAGVELSDDVAQTVELFATNGQRVSVSFEIQDNMIMIPTALLAPGIYFVKITGEKAGYVGKFVKGQ